MRRFAALFLASVSLTAPVLVQAAATAGPDALPGQVAGVIGSGSQLALQLKPVGQAPLRTLHVGDSFEDGWVLSGLNASTATLTKAGVTRTVGLNPGGAVAGAAAPVGGATVTVIAPTGPRPPQAPLTPQEQAARDAAVLDAAPPELRPALMATQKAAQSVRDNGAALSAAIAALNAATPEARPAAQERVNQATRGLVAAQNEHIAAVRTSNQQAGWASAP